MLEIAFHNPLDQDIPGLEELQTLSERILSTEKYEGLVNVVFTDDDSVQELNREYRNKDKTTDVLSFPWHDEDMLGEIYISIPQVQRQAPEWNNTYAQELKRMLVHGMLHLCEYDHIEDEDYKIMKEREEFYLS